MNKRCLGNLEVSEIGMGCMGFSHGYGKVPEEDYSIDAIRSAYDFGCTFFDTAETYGREQFYPGHNEELVGKALEPFRGHVVLATKFHLAPEEYTGPGTLFDVISRHLAASMKRLRTDCIDLYYLHRVECCPIFQGKFFHFLAVNRHREIEHNVFNPTAVLPLFRKHIDSLNKGFHKLFLLRFRCRIVDFIKRQ